MTSDLEAKLGAWMQSVPVSESALADLRSLELPARQQQRWSPRLFAAGVIATVSLAAVAALLWTPMGRPHLTATSVPSSVPTSSATSTVSGKPALCKSTELSATGETVGSALGNGGAIVRVQNVGDAPCFLSGYPDVTLVGATVQSLRTVATRAIDGAYLFPAIPVSDIELSPGDVASFQLGYPELASGPDADLPLEVACPPASGLRFTLPGSDTPLVAQLKFAPCEGQVGVSPLHAGGAWIGFSDATPSPSQANLTSMAWFDRQHGLFVGDSSPDGSHGGTIWRTSDGGRTWQAVSVPGGALNTVTVSGGVAWAGATCGLPAPCKVPLFRSEDGGATWERIAYQPVAWLAFADATHGWAIAFPEAEQPSAILESTDGGATWKPKASPCPPGTGVPVALSFPAPDRGWLACNGTVGAGNATKAVLRTTDGEHWQVMAAAPWPDEGQVVGSITSSGYLSGISMAARGVGMNWADRGVSERTADAGTTWIGMTATEFDVVIPAAGWVIDDSDWLLWVWNGDAHRYILEESTDGGATWGEAAGFVAPS